MVGPELEVGTKIREAASYWSSSGHLELIVRGLLFDGRLASDTEQESELNVTSLFNIVLEDHPVNQDEIEGMKLG